METIRKAIEVVMHLDKYLSVLVSQYQAWTYMILFLIIFCETGLVVTPFLPGDSLLFAAGAVTALPDSPIRVLWLFLLLSAAAVLGDTVNYWIGKIVGPKVFSREDSRFFKKKYLDRTHQFYEKYGAETIILARFVPIVRTFAPFVAGIGKMSYSRFLAYNIVGGVAWVALFLFAGHFFGNIPFVKRHFSLVIFAIIGVSLIPAVWEFVRSRRTADGGKGR